MGSSDLTLVILDNPGAVWLDPEAGRSARSLFEKLITLKLKGYGKHYLKGVLPCDTSDFFGTHIAICSETRDGFEPLLAYRAVSAVRSRFYHCKFSFLEVLRSCQVKVHEEIGESLIARTIEQGRDAVYYSSYTIAPEIKGDQALVNELKDIMTGTHKLWVESHAPRENIILSVVDNKVNQYFQSWGYEVPRTPSGPLPQFFYRDYQVFLEFLTLSRFSEHSTQMAEKHASLWEMRKYIGPETLPETKLKVA